MFILTLVISASALPVFSQWHQDYKQARRSNPTDACAIYQRLALDTTEPISPLAIVRREETCAQKSFNALKDLIEDAKLDWLHPLALRQAFAIAVSQGLDHEVIPLAQPLVEQLDSQRDRQLTLEQAIQAARNLGRQNSEADLTSRLYEIAPRLIPQPLPSQWQAVAEDYKRNRQYQLAANFYFKIFQNSSSWTDQLDALDGVRRSIKEKFRTGQGPIEEFFKASEDFGQFAFQTLTTQSSLSLEEQRQLVLAYFQHGRDIWSYAETDAEQRAGVTNIVRNYLNLPNTPDTLKAEAWVLLARVSQNYRDWSAGALEAENAVRLLRNSRRQWTKWQKELYDNALWFDAHLTRKDGRLIESLHKMQQVATDSQAEWARRRARFWLGRTSKQLGQTAEADAYYQSLIQDYPYHYYALWAQYDSGISLNPVSPLHNHSPARPQTVSAEDHVFILSLVEAGEQELARKYLNRFLSSRSTDVRDLLYRNFVGDHSTVIRTFFAHMNGTQRRNIQDNYLGLIYPQPHRDLVAQQATRWNSLDAYYVYSIMRQESGFNPSSHSWADARGLLQLVPRVARQEQQRGGVSFQHVDELFIPEVNIPIGIAALDTRFQLNFNKYIVATASYNAGEGRVHGWLNNLYRGDVFEFMEDIPTEETRVYIRLVARNYVRNMQLNATQPFLIPDWLFDMP